MKPSEIRAVISAGHRPLVASQMIFGASETYCFVGKKDVETIIVNKIANFFGCPSTEVFFVGSAHVGYSAYKNKPFSENSDLDVAIVSPVVFLKYMKLIRDQTKGFTDVSVKFPNSESSQCLMEYIVRKGIINPIHLPYIQARDDILKYFNNLSFGYKSNFRNISSVIYSDADSFFRKQESFVKIAKDIQ